MKDVNDPYIRFNSLKIVPGCEVCALFEAKPGQRSGPYVYARLLRFTEKKTADILVIKSGWPMCKVGIELNIRIEHLTLAIKLGNFPTGVTEEEYQHHEALMNKPKQLALFI